MARFKYRAKDIYGKHTRGIMEAADEAALYAQLRQKGLYLEDSVEKKEEVLSHRLSARALSEFCRELGTLLQTGVPLVRAMGILCQEEGLGKKERAVYEKLQKLLRQGISLDDAMRKQGDAFPELLIYIVEAAGQSGGMDRMMLRMAAQYDRENRLAGKIKSAMTYPLMLLVLMAAAVAFIVSYVLPQFESFFATMEELPLSTKILLAVSGAIRGYWYIILMVLVLCYVLFQVLLTLPRFRVWRDRMLVHLPVIGPLLKTICTSRFTRTLSSLYSAGLPITVSLQVARRTIGNAYIEQQFDQVSAMVRKGENLSAALRPVDGFVRRLSASVMVGEETGRLDAMLDALADTLDDEAELAMNRLVTLLEPLMIILMAVIVGFVMISVMSTIIGSYEAIDNM